MRILLLFLSLFCFTFYANAQACTGCKTTLNDYSGNLTVRGNESICLTGTFNGNIELNGGKIFICGNATIGVLTFKRRSNCTISESAIVKIQTISNQNNIDIVNYCDSLVIGASHYDQPFNLTNHGKCYLNGGNFNNQIDFINTDTLIINSNITVSTSSSFTNSKYLVINGNFLPNNATVIFDNLCQVLINGDMVLNRQDIKVDGGFLKVNNVNINSGSITLKNAAIFYVNSINIGGFVNGLGSRSTMVCNQSPNLNAQPSIKGAVSVCVKNGNFVPNPGTIRQPASVDCNNPIGGSECNPIPFGYPFFRMKPQTSSEWDSSYTWEMQDAMNNWGPAPAGRFPGLGSAVLIGDGKTMTITKETKISRLILGEAGNGKIICSPNHIADMIVDDTVEFKNQSSIELNKSTLFVNGKSFTDIKFKGSPNAKLSIHLPQQNKNLVMDQSDPGISNSLHSLTLNGEASNLTLADTLIVRHIINPKSGTITTNGKLVLRSDKDFTASIGPGSGNYIVGKVKVERYIPSIARRFRFVSPTTKNANLLEWQDNVYITGNNAAGTATGQKVGTLNSAGFDANQNFEPSMYSYDETKTGNQNNGWVAATNETNTLASFPLPVGKGYRLFIRGDRSDTNRLNGANNTQNEVTMNMLGELVTGDVEVPITYTSTNVKSEDGWNLIGNPYASAYDWKTFYIENNLGSDFEPNVWVYDSETNTYASYNVLAEAGSFTNGIIPSGQSFWVKALGGLLNGKITLKEKYKIESVENDKIRVTNGGSTYDNTISIRLIKDSVNQDEMIVKFMKGAVKGVGPLDIDKFWSDQVGIAQYVGGQNAYLDLSTRPLEFGALDSVLIYYFVAENGTYTLEMKMANDSLSNKGAKAYLYDVQEDTFVNIATNPVYIFTVNMPNPEYGEVGRFYIKYYTDTPATAFVNYLYADKQDTTGVLVSWGSLSEPLPTLYTVQRGYDSINFVTIATTNSIGAYGVSSDYEFLDTLADLSKDMYYRIGKQDSINTEMAFSHTVFLSHINAGIKEQEQPFKEGLIVYPIPSQHMLTLAYRNKLFDGKISVTMMDITGKKVMETILGGPGIKSKTLSLDISALDQGIYFMQLTNKNGESAVRKVVKN